jgi:hypothetical protein
MTYRVIVPLPKRVLYGSTVRFLTCAIDNMSPDDILVLAYGFRAEVYSSQGKT